MKKLLLLLLVYIFYVGFFTFHKGNTFLLSLFTDKQLHLIAFIVYPLSFYILLPKRFTVSFLILLFFGVMTFGVEIIQRKYFHRCYSLSDFKYSFLGFFVSACLIFYFSYVTPYFTRAIFRP